MKKYLIEFLVIVITVAVIGGFDMGEKQKVIHNQSISTRQAKVQPEELLVCGYPLKAVLIDTERVKRNQNLSDILLPRGISAACIDRLAKNSKNIFDVRKIQAGNTYYIINSGVPSTPRAMVYEESVADYVVFNIDSFSIYRGEKKIDSVEMATGGIIETSLWNAFADNGNDPLLAVKLADIFAWAIDFFGIQKGDQFEVLYDALYVDGKFAGIGKIHAANFIHMGSRVSAYYYDHNDQKGFFDEEGNSLRKAFLKAPLSYTRISSRYSNSRMHPVLKIKRPHRGVDYAAPKGTPVYSIGDGVIVKKGYQKRGGGNYLSIKHNSVYTSQYMHLDHFARGIARGIRVKQGQLIGYVGMTGLATGPHLDFRIYKNGYPIDPLKVKAPPVEPIRDENKFAFDQLRDSLQEQLNQITVKNPAEILAVKE